MNTEIRKKSDVLELVVVFLLLGILVAFSETIVSLGGSRITRMMLTVAVYIGIAGFPLLALLLRRIPLAVLHFYKKDIGRQLVVALLIFAVTISAGVVIPLVIGVSKSDIFSFKSASVPVLVFYVLYDLLCVGFGEEIAFRGYLYGRIKSLTSIAWLPAVLSAVLFGLWHYPNTHSIINVASTTVLGLFYGLCRWKARGCSLLSLSIAHGLNDAAIIVLSYFFL